MDEAMKRWHPKYDYHNPVELVQDKEGDWVEYEDAHNRIEELKAELLQAHDWLDRILLAYTGAPSTRALTTAIILVRQERRKARGEA